MAWCFCPVGGKQGHIFPGFINNFDQIQGFHGKDLRWHKPFDFDHISLEKNRSTWHVTSKHRKDHLGGPRTLSLGQSRVLWLGISVADAHMMRIVKQETKIVSDSPPSDSQRRLKAFFKAREGAKFPIVSINNDNPIQFNEWFLHFCLIVGPKNFSFYQGGELGFPHGSPYLATSFPEELTALPLRSHRLELSDKIDIQITVCCLPGKLKTPVTITSPSKPSTALNSDTP